jgi:LAO/AO transport system kinase
VSTPASASGETPSAAEAGTAGTGTRLALDARAGSRLALSRLLTAIESRTAAAEEALRTLYPAAGGAHVVGITGPPGGGKSTLVAALVAEARAGGRAVAVLAIDPSSPVTGGAILGDRIRMRDLTGDPGVFIRSMASRGSLGGLASATAGVVQLFDAAGFDVVLIETVGAGQAEVDIARLAHTTLVVEAPGLGDDIQAIKAGILEIADVLVINKADHPGVDGTERALRSMLEMAHPARREFYHHGQMQTLQAHAAEADPAAPLWIPPVLRTIATEGIGLPELMEAIACHQAHLRQSGDWQRRERFRLQAELDTLIQETLVARWRESVSAEAYQQAVDDLLARKAAPHQAVSRLTDLA